MATSDLLNKLRTDITDTYTSINNLGGTIPEHKNTENIAPAIESVYNKLPKVSDTGTDLNLSPTIEARLGLIPRGNTYQLSTTGKNLFKPIPSATKAGITFANNGDGSYTLNGTATSNTSFYITNVGLSSGQYTISANNTQTSSGIILQLETSNGNKNFNLSTVNASQTYNCDNINALVVIVQNGTSLNNFIIKPQLELGSSATSYEPYTGGQPSPNPDYPQIPKVVTGENSVKVENRNLFDGARENVYFDNTNNFINRGDALTTNYINANAGDIFTISTETASNGIVIASFDENYNCLLRNASGSSSLTLTHTCPANTKYVIASNYIGMTTNTQLQKGSTATAYVEHQEQNYPLDIPFELAKIGDYEDYIEGTPDNWSKKEVITKFKVDETGGWDMVTDRTNSMYIQRGYFKIFVPTSVSETPSAYMTHFKPEKANDLYNSDTQGFTFTTTGYLRINILKSVASTINDFKTWISSQNVYIYYPLETPNTIPITDTTLISQLNALYYANSYDDETNVSSTYTSGNMPMIFTASALKGESNA